jgi:hypothetical protein
MFWHSHLEPSTYHHHTSHCDITAPSTPNDDNHNGNGKNDNDRDTYPITRRAAMTQTGPNDASGAMRCVFFLFCSFFLYTIDNFGFI